MSNHNKISCREHIIGKESIGDQIMGLPFSHEMDLDEKSHSSKSQFPHLQNGKSQVYIRNNQDSVGKCFHIWWAFITSHFFLGWIPCISHFCCKVIH